MYMYTILYTHIHIWESLLMHQENISQLLMNISPGGFVPTAEAPVPLTSLHIALPWAHVKRPGNVAKMIQHPLIFPSNASSMWNVVTAIVSADSPFLSFSPLFQFLLRFPSFSILFVLKRILLSTSIFLTPRKWQHALQLLSLMVQQTLPVDGISVGAVVGAVQRTLGEPAAVEQLKAICKGWLDASGDAKLMEDWAMPWEKDQRMALDAKNTQFRSVLTV